MLELLRNEGFVDAGSIPKGENRPPVMPKQALILARIPEEETGERPLSGWTAKSSPYGICGWFLATRGGFSQNLARHIDSLGDFLLTGFPGGTI